MRTSTAIKTLLPLLVLVSLGLVVAALTGVFDDRAPGPVPIAWDHEVCAECHMHIGDPAYAAQLQTRAGEVLNFDDPGCLFRFLARASDEPQAIYFHHLREDRWLRRDEVGFVEQPESQTPMGSGLGAVDRRAPGAIAFDQVARLRSGGSAP